MSSKPRFALAAVVTLAGFGQAQSWVQSTPSSSPSARDFPALAYDTGRSVFVLHGGFDAGSAVALDETWEYGGTAWTLRTPALRPPRRDSAALVYDSARSVTLLFGGWDTLGNALADTWTWNGSQWTNATPTGTSPSARLGHAMAHDITRQRVTLFGGIADTLTTNFGDTWEWDGAAWVQASPRTLPGARDGHGMAYDTARQRIVMFGGEDAAFNLLADTWEYDGRDWLRVTTAASPSPRGWFGISYDAAKSRVVVHGGVGATGELADTWEFDGNNWVLQTTTPTPGARGGNVMGAAPVGNSLHFGGFAGASTFNDTWTYTARTTGSAGYATVGAGCPGTGGITPRLAAAPGSVPALGTAFFVDVTQIPITTTSVVMLIGVSDRNSVLGPLPVSLQVIGLTGCTLYVSLELALPVSASAARAQWRLPLPVDPTLVGARFYNQAVIPDLGASNPLGLTVSNAGRALVN